jgi:phospholipid transport system substrate-binding protein
MLGLSAFATAAPAFAARNADAERYVQENATTALQTLADRNVSTAQRRQTFDSLMNRFADMPRIASFVLGRYGASLRADAALRDEWNRTFRDYSIAVYEDRLDRYSGNAIRVTGSVERIAGRDVIVQSEISPRGGGRPLPVEWRILRVGNAWKVVDIALILDGNQIWLAQQQQREFLAALDRNNGDIRALMVSLRQTTAQMRERVLARNA